MDYLNPVFGQSKNNQLEIVILIRITSIRISKRKYQISTESTTKKGIQSKQICRHGFGFWSVTFIGTECGPEFGTKNPFWYGETNENSERIFLFLIFRNFAPYQEPYRTKSVPVRIISYKIRIRYRTDKNPNRKSSRYSLSKIIRGPP